jgi:hypothetical protein
VCPRHETFSPGTFRPSRGIPLRLAGTLLAQSPFQVVVLDGLQSSEMSENQVLSKFHKR